MPAPRSALGLGLRFRGAEAEAGIWRRFPGPSVLSQPRPGPWPGGPGGKLEATFRGLYPGARSRSLRNRRAPPAGGRTGLARGASCGRGSVRSAGGSSRSPSGGRRWPGPGAQQAFGSPRRAEAAEAKSPGSSLHGGPLPAGRQALLVPLISEEPEAARVGTGRPFCPPRPTGPCSPH